MRGTLLLRRAAWDAGRAPAASRPEQPRLPPGNLQPELWETGHTASRETPSGSSSVRDLAFLRLSKGFSGSEPTSQQGRPSDAPDACLKHSRLTSASHCPFPSAPREMVLKDLRAHATLWPEVLRLS